MVEEKCWVGGKQVDFTYGECQNQIYLILAGNFYTFVQFLQRWIGHHTWATTARKKWKW